MLARLRLVKARLLPHGWLDVLRQVSFFAVAYGAYRIVRGVVDTSGTAAFQHAREVIQLERTLHVFVEPSVQAWVAGSHLVMTVASWLYLNAQFTITVGALLYLYTRHHHAFHHVRDTLLIAMAIALVGYAVFPTAPPRFLPEWGFIEAGSSALAGPTGSSSALFSAFANPYAAVPSMHVAFALTIAWPLARIVRRRWVGILWRLYPLLIVFVIIVTGNHFIFDVVTGALTAAISAWTARWLERLRSGGLGVGSRTAAANPAATGATV